MTRRRTRGAVGVLLAASLPLSALTAAPARVAAQSRATSSAARTCAVRVLSRLTLAQEVGQLFMLAVSTRPTSTQLDLISRYHVGAVLLAHDSEAGVAVTRSRVARLRRAAGTAGVGLWVAADQEGGYVQHLKGAGFSTIPTALAQGRWSPATLRARAAVWGAQLRDAGVNLDLAPVADTVPARLGTRNQPIGYYFREYGHRPGVVSSHALAVRQGMRDAHVQTTAKHFPGLGRVIGNTDTTYGVTDSVTTRDGHYEPQPFRDLVGDGIPVVMISSARYTRIDAAHIGPMSATLIRGMLRHDLGFRGTVLSDSLSAAALSHVPVAARAVRFLRAGGDVALVGRPSQLEPMLRAVLQNARSHRHHPLVDGAALHVLRSKARQGLLTCSASGSGR